jgi:hypothetical protein
VVAQQPIHRRRQLREQRGRGEVRLGERARHRVGCHRRCAERCDERRHGGVSDPRHRPADHPQQLHRRGFAEQTGSGLERPHELDLGLSEPDVVGFGVRETGRPPQLDEPVDPHASPGGDLRRHVAILPGDHKQFGGKSGQAAGLVRPDHLLNRAASRLEQAQEVELLDGVRRARVVETGGHQPVDVEGAHAIPVRLGVNTSWPPFASPRQSLMHAKTHRCAVLHRPSVAKRRPSMSCLGQASTGHELTTIMNVAYGRHPPLAHPRRS